MGSGVVEDWGSSEGFGEGVVGVGSGFGSWAGVVGVGSGVGSVDGSGVGAGVCFTVPSPSVPPPAFTVAVASRDAPLMVALLVYVVTPSMGCVASGKVTHTREPVGGVKVRVCLVSSSLPSVHDVVAGSHVGPVEHFTAV